MKFQEIHHIVSKHIDRTLNDMRVTRRRLLATLLSGLLLANHCRLNRIANKLPWPFKSKSLIQRIWRFINNDHIDPLKLYAPFAKKFLSFFRGQRIRLLIDRVEVDSGHNILFVALAFRKRALPIVWSILDHKKGVSSFKEQWNLIERVIPLLPECEIILIGDREFQNNSLMNSIKSLKWHFRIRLKGNTWITLHDGRKLQLRDLPLSKGESYHLQGVYLTSQEYGPLNIALFWSEDEDEPLFIATDEEANSQTLRDYSKRMWIDEMFSDFKERGFHLDKSRIRKPENLSRLILVISLAYVWLSQLGICAVKRGLRSFIDGAKQRSLSYFQLGLRWFERCLSLNRNISLSFTFYP